MCRKHRHYFKNCEHLQCQLVIPEEICVLFNVFGDLKSIVTELLTLNSNVFVYNPYKEVDVYAILDMYCVTNSQIAHAVKKLLVAGGRGYKDIRKDLSEVVDTLERHLELLDETYRHYYSFVNRTAQEHRMWKSFQNGKFLDVDLVQSDKSDEYDVHVEKIQKVISKLEKYIETLSNLPESELAEEPRNFVSSESYHDNVPVENLPIGPVRVPTPLPPELSPEQIEEITAKLKKKETSNAIKRKLMERHGLDRYHPKYMENLKKAD